MNIKRRTKDARRNGSAIILAIVLTTLLAMLGVLFLLSSRVNSVATSAVGDNQDLKLAVDSVVAQISQVLASNVPGDPCAPQEYYDYPDPCSNIDSWLACMEPYNSGTGYRWRHVTDLYNAFPVPMFSRDIPAAIVPEYRPTVGSGLFADADGDGVSDSIWVQVQANGTGITSSKGKPIYAAIRIIDNGGMLNLNTGDKFDPFDPNHSDGSSQTQINLMALSWRPNDPLFPYNPAAENTLLLMRNPSGLPNYENNVVWQYGLPNGYTPFDISDELELRYRYLINQTSVDTRFEVMKNWQIGRTYDFQTPIDTNARFNEWEITATADGLFADPNQYAYRHIATTYNCDRIINPAGHKMFNINSPLTFDVNSIYNAVRVALDPCVFSSVDVAQITANLMDYIDGPNYPTWDPRYDPNNNVTVVYDSNGTPHYGFERPCIYISEIAQNFYKPADANIDPNIYRSYAIELFKPYWEDDEPNGWQIVTTDLDPNGDLVSNTTPIIWTGSRRFHVLANINTTVPEANIPIDFNDIAGPNDFSGFDPSKLIHQPQAADINFAKATNIVLQRYVNGSWIPVDVFVVPQAEAYGSRWLDAMDGQPRSFERDITVNRCVRRILNTSVTVPTLGHANSFAAPPGSLMIQAHPANKPFTNVGEIGQLLSRDQISVDQNSTEAEVRLNLAEPNFQNLFNYLTVMDPNDHSQPAAETKIKGRININTAPWFVLAQLPWLSYHTPNYELARSIVNNRDTYGAFKSTGELLRVINSFNDFNSMSYYQGKAIPAGLLTPPDGTGDTFEERDVIFDRISNLVTVRSDVFTAYILVRIGPTGPQKRAIAIFDRSNIVPNLAYNPNDNPARYFGKVKVIAIQPVPDPR
jgi:DNA uptake protein ComE-like DNA-binding protein